VLATMTLALAVMTPVLVTMTPVLAMVLIGPVVTQ